MTEPQPPSPAPTGEPSAHAAGQLSLDRRWMWNGTQWQPAVEASPAAREIEVRAGTAFKLGFFGFLGGLVAYLLVAAGLLLLFGLFALCSSLAATRH